MSYGGSANFADVAVKVEDTEIEKIAGTTTFNDAELNLNASAEANGQKAKAYGKIYTNTDEPYFNIHAESESFNPSAIIENIGVDCVAKFKAHMTGTATNPIVVADIETPRIAYENLTAYNVSTKMKYENDSVHLADINAETFGGRVTGEATLDAKTLDYNAHIKANGLDVSRLRDFAEIDAPVVGKIFADLGINGRGKDMQALKVYGSATASDVIYSGIQVNSADTSFALEGDDLKIDYLSLALPDRGSIGAEGTITDLNKLDLAFYGGHVDMSIARNLNELIDISGLADFKGTVHGDADNPNIDLKFSGVDHSRSPFQTAL